MRYHTTMLCGGQSMMLTPSGTPCVDMGSVVEAFKDSVLRSSEEMVEIVYRDIKITVYPNGSVMFYHFIDYDAAIVIADEILGKVS